MNPRRVGNHHFIEGAVQFGSGCIVHPFAYLGKCPSQSKSLARCASLVTNTVVIGNNTEIGPHAVVYTGAHIGNDCLIGDGANIREGARIGDRCIIGTHVCISYDAELADDVRVQNGTHVTDGCRVGRGTFIGVNVTMMSDRRRDVVDYVFKGSDPPIIGERCLIGSGAVLLPGIRIGDGAVIGAGAVVTKDVPAGATVLGQAARVVDAPSS